MSRNRVILAPLSLIIIVVAGAYFTYSPYGLHKAKVLKYERMAINSLPIIEYVNVKGRLDINYDLRSKSYYAAHPLKAVALINYEHKLLLQSDCEVIFGNEKLQRYRLNNSPRLTQIVATLDGFCLQPTKEDYLAIYKALTAISDAKENDYTLRYNHSINSYQMTEDERTNMLINAHYQAVYHSGKHSYFATALLGEMHQKGLGVDKSIQRAKEHFRTAILGHSGVILSGPRAIPFHKAKPKKVESQKTLRLHESFMPLDSYQHTTGLTFWDINAQFGDVTLGLRDWPKPMQDEIKWFNFIKTKPRILYQLAKDLWSGTNDHPKIPQAAFNILDVLVTLNDYDDPTLLPRWITWAYAPILGSTNTENIFNIGTANDRIRSANDKLVWAVRARHLWTIPTIYCLVREGNENGYESGVFPENEYVRSFVKKHGLLNKSKAPENTSPFVLPYNPPLDREAKDEFFRKTQSQMYLPYYLDSDPIEISHCMKALGAF